MIITDDAVKARVLNALADDYSRRIITAAMDQAKSALDLSRECGIPITTAYRRIQVLVDAGLLGGVRSGRTEDGKWYDLYKSILKKIDVSFEQNEVRLDVTLNENMSDKFTKPWTSLRQEGE